MRACNVQLWLTSQLHEGCFDAILPVRVQAYYRVYKEHIPVAQLCREVAAVMQEFTRARPLQNFCACYGDMLIESKPPGELSLQPAMR